MEGVYTGSGSRNFHLGAPLGQYFAKPGVCNLLIKVLTLGQLTRLISPGRQALWPQGKLKHIRNILSKKENLFVKVKGDRFAKPTDWEEKELRVVCSRVCVELIPLSSKTKGSRFHWGTWRSKKGFYWWFCEWWHLKTKCSSRGQWLRGGPPRLLARRSMGRHPLEHQQPLEI